VGFWNDSDHEEVFPLNFDSPPKMKSRGKYDAVVCDRGSGSSWEGGRYRAGSPVRTRTCIENLHSASATRGTSGGYNRGQLSPHAGGHAPASDCAGHSSPAARSNCMTAGQLSGVNCGTVGGSCAEQRMRVESSSRLYRGQQNESTVAGHRSQFGVELDYRYPCNHLIDFRLQAMNWIETSLMPVLSPNLRTPNPGVDPPYYIANVGGGMNPGLNPGFCVLRCGPWTQPE
jgi:hypothetical protein